MPALHDYTNVFDTALSILQDKGYQLWHDKTSNTYFAEKGGWDFSSPSPVGLLGVVAIFEAVHPKTYEEYWWRIERRIHRQLPATPPRPYVPVWEHPPSE